ncbi:MAG: hypothetical protein IM600_17995 [Bacteroidetes bacterium]|nr:hypothetical protein [Bacteroidota bacterium]MCA6445325.1 hypothetical protein [Bacteroidota bacterium]
MVRIFNLKTNKSIEIDETLPEVGFEPNDWQELPHVIIKLPEVHFANHCKTCEDCNSLLNAFGTECSDWQIEYLGKIKRLNLKTLNPSFSANKLNFIISNYFSGTILKLNIDTDTVDSLKKELISKEEIEDYESCKKIVDKIKAITGAS